jgi:phage tail tape-measure protein
LANLNTTRRAELMAKNRVYATENTYKATELSRKELESTGISDEDMAITGGGIGIGTGLGLAGGAIAAMATGAGLGSAVPVVGTIIGAVVGLVGGIVAAAVSNDATEQEEEALKKIAALSQEERDALLSIKDAEKLQAKLDE